MNADILVHLQASLADLFAAIFHGLDAVALTLAPFLVAAYILFGLDDFFVDAVALVNGLKPRRLSPARYRRLRVMPEKRIAIMVASWKEAGVLTKMVRGNVRNIDYRNYDFFLGVYPNDEKTMAEAKELEAQFPNVHCVVNAKDGPTSKGQMVNEIARAIFAYELKNPGARFDCAILHDSEDLIHREAFRIINWKLEDNDFIQVPIFSLPVSHKQLVAGTYIDEFSESHTKDILVRHRLGAAIPSAGVGTAMSRKLVQTYMAVQAGDLLNQKSLTEDYELGVSTTRYGLKSTFAAYYLEGMTAAGKKRREYIATREYFPKAFYRSIKQKTRWTFGIAFQGTEHLGWQGSLAHKYFLFRDRKGPVSNILVLIGTGLFLYSLARLALDREAFTAVMHPEGEWHERLLMAGFGLNAFFMLNRLFQRMACVHAVYGLRTAILAPVRLPIANVINAAASVRAIKQYADHKISGLAPQWSKTEHELPEDFGMAPADGAIIMPGLTTSVSAAAAAIAAPAQALGPAAPRERIAARPAAREGQAQAQPAQSAAQR